MSDRDEQAGARAGRALSSPMRLRILRLCGFHARTNKELAELLGVNPGTMLHHVRTLVAAGMLEAQEERTGTRGAREVPYRATGRSWRAPVPSQSVVVMETVRQQLEAVDPNDVEVAWMGLRLNAEHERELRERIGSLLDEFRSRGHDEDGTPLSLTVVIHPDDNPEPPPREE